MNSEIETLTDEEIVSFVRYFEHATLTYRQGLIMTRNRLICLLMLDAGLRVGEVVRLQKLSLCISGAPVSTIVLDHLTAEKCCSRNIPVTVRLRDAIQLMNLNVWQPLEILDLDSALALAPHEPVLSVRQIERIVDQVSVSSIRRHIHPHVLRHTFATRLMRVCNVRVVQQLLGHSSLLSTQIYTHPSTNDLQSAIESIN